MQFKLVRFIFFSLTLLLAPSALLGEKFDTILIKDLSDDYLVFDYRYDTYVPLSGEKTCVANIYYDFSLYSDYNLAFTAAPGLALFIDHRLIYENVSSAKETAIVPVKSFLNGNPGKSLLTFYQKEKKLPADISLSHISTGVESADVSFKTRLANDLKNKKLFYVLILILTLFAIVRQRFPRKFFEMIYPVMDENISLYNFFSKSSLLFIFLNSLCFTYLIALYPFGDLISIENFWDFGSLTLFIFTGFYIKYILLHITSSIFGLQGFDKVHFLEIIRLATKSNLVLVPVVTIASYSELLSFNVPYSTYSVLVILILVFVLFKLIVLTLRVPGFKNIYLFSYLCIAEVIPLGFALKVTLLS